uniref:Superoxide dismutase [Cu-Zn] n=1 Tax=Oxya chinensis TaxID=165482 RepID=A0A5Q0MVW9_9ORTH|nr:intracellular CuZn superoxide dismutase [Oxya chinensis]
MVLQAVCVMIGEVVNGLIRFSQEQEDAPVKITGEIKGLNKGKHGFHVHEFGDISDGCTSAGPHYNPLAKDHGGPDDVDRHIGDLGNVTAGDDGVAKVCFFDKQISLIGKNSIIGRTLVVHADPDDLGRGDHPLSRTTGNSGARVACGIIGVAK